MRNYSEAVKADMSRRMSPPHRQSVARISEELGIHVDHPLQLEEDLAVAERGGPASEKNPDGWSAADCPATFRLRGALHHSFVTRFN
jgi:transposase